MKKELVLKADYNLQPLIKSEGSGRLSDYYINIIKHIFIIKNRLIYCNGIGLINITIENENNIYGKINVDTYLEIKRNAKRELIFSTEKHIDKITSLDVKSINELKTIIKTSNKYVYANNITANFKYYDAVIKGIGIKSKNAIINKFFKFDNTHFNGKNLFAVKIFKKETVFSYTKTDYTTFGIVMPIDVKELTNTEDIKNEK